MRGGRKEPIFPKNRVIEEQKTIQQEAQNVAIAMEMGPLNHSLGT